MNSHFDTIPPWLMNDIWDEWDNDPNTIDISFFDYSLRYGISKELMWNTPVVGNEHLYLLAIMKFSK